MLEHSWCNRCDRRYTYVSQNTITIPAQYLEAL